MRRLHALAVVSLLFTAFASGQDWDARGSIKSGDSQIPHRNGGVVEGTEFVHFEYRVSTSLVSTEDTKKKLTVVHNNVCKGGKHKNHGECDRSCDTQDKKTKKITIRGESEALTAKMREMEAQSAKMAGGLTADGNPGRWSSETSSYIRQMRSECDNTTLDVEVKPHDLACTCKTRKYGVKKTELKVKGEFWKVGFYRSRGVDTPINEMVSSHDGTVAYLWYPTADVLDDKDVVTCRCKEKPKDRPVLCIPVQNPITDGPVFEGCIFQTSDGGYCVPDPKQVEISCTGNSLTKCEIEVVNNCSEDLVCTIPPGCELVPDDGGCQVMTCTEACKVPCPAGSRTVFYVSIRPTPLLVGKATMRVACTEMLKHEPTEKTKFKLAGPQDPMLVCILSQPPTSSFFANAVTQGRVWIYKDHATMEEINKRMAPGLTEGMYLNALYDVARSGVDVTAAAYKKCLNPNLLRGGSATAEATGWYVRLLEKVAPKSFSSVVDHYGKLANPTEGDMAHAATLAEAMSQAKDKDVRAQAAALMEKGVPAGMREVFLKEGGANALRALIYSSAPGEAMRGVAIAKSFGDSARALLKSCAAWGNSAEVREAAAKAIS